MNPESSPTRHGQVEQPPLAPVVPINRAAEDYMLQHPIVGVPPENVQVGTVAPDSGADEDYVGRHRAEDLGATSLAATVSLSDHELDGLETDDGRISKDRNGRWHISGVNASGVEGGYFNKFLSNDEVSRLRARANAPIQPPVNPPNPPQPPAPPAPAQPNPGHNGPPPFFMEHEIDEGLLYDLAMAENDYMILMAAYESSSWLTLKTRLTSRDLEGGDDFDGFDNPIEHGLEPGEKVRATQQRVEDARLEVDRLRGLVRQAEFDIMEAEGVDPAEQSVISQVQEETEAIVLRDGTRFSIEDISDSKRQRHMSAEQRSWVYKRRTKFYAWWQRQGGGGRFFSKKRMIGNVKKGAVIGLVGLPLGIAAGAAGVLLAPAVGGVAGGLAAGAAARAVTRGWLRGRIDKGANARNVAMNHTRNQYDDQMRRINDTFVANQALAPRDQAASVSVTDGFAEHTGEHRNRNRRRDIGSVIIGAGAGVGGAYAGEALHHVFSSIFDSNPTPKGGPSTGGNHGHGSGAGSSGNAGTGHGSNPGSGSGTPPAGAGGNPSGNPAPNPHGATGQEFYVEHGSGEIREISEYASAHHYNVTPDQAHNIYEQLFSQRGSKIVNLHGAGSDTYIRGSGVGNIGLSHPGEATWYPGVEDQMRHMLEEASKGNLKAAA